MRRAQAASFSPAKAPGASALWSSRQLATAGALDFRTGTFLPALETCLPPRLLLEFEGEVNSRDLCVGTGGHQLVELLGKAVEPLGGGESLGNWPWGSIARPHFLFLLCSFLTTLAMPTASLPLLFGLLFLLPFLRHQGEMKRTLPHSSLMAG